MQVQSTPMSSTKTPLAKSSKKPRVKVQNTSGIKDKEVMENGAKVSKGRIARTMKPNEAIASATKSPALQRALEMIRDAGPKVRKRKTMAKGKSEVIAPESMGMMNKGATSISKEIVNTTIPEDDHVIIPTIKSFEIDITEKIEVGMIPENSSKKEKHCDYDIDEI